MKALCAESESHGLRIAPLIDIVFLLLIFFLVATTFYEAEKDITIRLADASEGQDREKSPRVIVVNVNASGVIVVNQRVMTLDQLRDHMTSAREQNPNLVAVVRCDKRAYHADFVKVLNLCEKMKVTQVAVATFQTGE
jgi:biopolymer transport protein ExbD